MVRAVYFFTLLDSIMGAPYYDGTFASAQILLRYFFGGRFCAARTLEYQEAFILIRKQLLTFFYTNYFKVFLFFFTLVAFLCCLPGAFSIPIISASRWN